jgi:hypothetical protein
MTDRPALPSTAVTGIALDFVAELQAGRRPSIEAALDQAPKDEWPCLLQSLLIAETNARRSRGETPVAREYLPRFPAHTGVVRAVVPDMAPEPGCVLSPPPLPPRAILLPESPAILVGEAVAAPIPVRRPKMGWERVLGFLLIGIIVTGAGIISFRPRQQTVGQPAGPAPQAPAPPSPPKFVPKVVPVDPERDLAEWVLSLGGRGMVLPDGGNRRPFSADSPVPKVRFSVTGFSLPPEAANKWKPEDLERLRGRRKLSTVQFHLSGPLTEANLAPLAALPLRVLEIDATPVQVSGAFLAGFADLETLALPHCPDFADADLSAIGKLTKLSFLTLNSPKLLPNGFKELTCPVRFLALGDEVALSPNLVRVLQRLSLEGFESAAGMTDDAFVEFALFPDLKQIRLRHTKLTDAGLKAVVGLGRLEEFRCEGSAITGRGLEHLAERQGLKVLDLSAGKLTNESLGALLAVPALRELHLADNPIGDNGVTLLAQLDGIETLDLAGTAISDAGLRMLTKHATLKTLIVTDTRVTAAGVRAFETGTPGCRVEFGRR